MKKKLTINSIALGNLKQHKKQYIVMIIGIVLAMVFSSSVTFLISAMKNSFKEIRAERYGNQSFILLNTSEEEIHKAKENKAVGNAGMAHLVGSLKSGDEDSKYEIKVGWFDDASEELANPILIEGRMPTASNEIAVEKLSLSKLGITAKVGDEIEIDFYPQNGDGAMAEGHRATYKLVGILKDKYSYVSGRLYMPKFEYIPSAFVCKNTDIEPGGKEKVICYGQFFDNRETKHNLRKLCAFLESNGHEEIESIKNCLYFDASNTIPGDIDIAENGAFSIAIVTVMLIASCLVIANSFNSNLNERKKQIGVFRAIGATKQQIHRMFAREALIIALIATPVSCIISSLIVKTVLHFMGEMYIFKLNAWVVILAVIFCILCVMVSASIPLFSASRITPIQSIRNIENTRKLNKKKIKSKSKFDVPSILAKRSLTFSKGKQIAVSVILIVAIVGSGYAMSYYSYQKDYIASQMTESDYHLEIGYGRTHRYVNYSTENYGFTEQDRRFIEENEYIGDGDGIKMGEASLIMPIDTSDYRKEVSEQYYSDYYFYSPGAVMNESNYSEHRFFKRDDSPDVRKMKELLETDEYISTRIYSHDADNLKSLEKYVYDGKIDVDKINSGEEIILYAPKKVGATLITDEFQNETSLFYYINEEADVMKCEVNLESDFRAGEEIEIAVINGTEPVEVEGTNNTKTDIPDNVKVTKKKVKIGAVISDYGKTFSETTLAVITTTPIMNSLIPGKKYDTLNFNLNTSCTDEVEKSVMEDINVVSSKAENMYAHSNYGFAHEHREELNKILIAVMAVIILLFVISISIINNTLTSDIRNSKSKIGTLRAVGADERTIVKSYIMKLVSMLIWGSGIGLLGFFASYYCAYGINKLRGWLALNWNLILNPTAAIIFIILAFLICSLNLWLKVRKEMKNSIVENIREL